MSTKQRILFTLRENPTVTRELWEQFATKVRANGHQLGPVFRALMLRYIARGLDETGEEKP
jgi:hypothetical protein